MNAGYDGGMRIEIMQPRRLHKIRLVPTAGNHFAVIGANIGSIVVTGVILSIGLGKD